MSVTGADLTTGCAAALASFDRMSQRRLAAVIAHHTPSEAIEMVLGRREPSELMARLMSDGEVDVWRAALDEMPPDRWATRCAGLRVRAVTAHDHEYPVWFRHDPMPPAILFVRGSLDALERRRVAIVGTRNATRQGRETAFELGRDLTDAGVAIVSGLARGIDGAAHRGALNAKSPRPIGIAGNGLDRPYPASNVELWRDVASAGVLMSEWPPGTAPEPFRFPLRNRLIAALAEVVVVVESRETGGSLITAVAAAERDVEVMAVPGSVHNRSAAGTNRLLGDGVPPVTNADDVLVALGLDTRRASSSVYDPRPVPRDLEAAALQRIRRDPCTLDQLVVELDRPIDEVAMAIARLERTGWTREAGGWFEAVNVWGDVG